MRARGSGPNCGIAVLLLVLSACQESSKRAASESASATLSRPSATPIQNAAIPQVQVEATDTVGCELSRTVAHSDPDSLLHQFVQRDSAGQFTASSDWFNGAVDCPGHEPGPDVATTVRAYRLQEIARTDSMLREEVRWELPGQDGSAHLSTLAETLAVLRTPYGWRIQSPALNPKVPASRPGA